MKIETILNACQSTYIYRKARHTEPSIFFLRRHRQYHTFRDRIIRMDNDKDQTIRWMEHDLNLWREESKNED